MLIRTYTEPTKHPKWAGNVTPNTEYGTNPHYQEIADEFAKKGRAPGPSKWKEVRAIKGAAIISLSEMDRWWFQPEWMDRVFWVYYKPVGVMEDGKYYQTYLLEFYESQRVLAGTVRRFGRNIFNDPFPTIYIPCDVVQTCLWEFAAGESEHKRESVEPVLSNQEVEREQALDEAAKEIIKNGVDISNNPWSGDNVKGAFK